MTGRLQAADTVLGFFIEQIDGPYADVYFDSSAMPQPLVLNIATDTYKAVTFEWSGTELLDLRNLRLGADADTLTPVKSGTVTSNTGQFSLNGAASRTNAAATTEADGDLPFVAKISFPQMRFTWLSVERVARFQPLATNLRITLETDEGESTCVYDKSAREAALKKAVALQAQKVNAPKVVRLIVPALLDCVNLQLDATRGSFKRIRRRLGEDFFAAFGLNLNKSLLHTRKLEFGQHGVSHSFRYWSDAEKTALIDSYSVLVKAYKKSGFDSICCFGFLLGMVREDDLIPHDDDIDLLVFNYDTKMSDLHIMTLIIGIAAQTGFEVISIRFSQRFARLRTKDNRDFDVFICNVEGEKCFVYPSRSPYTHKDTIFPIKDQQAFNRNLPFPQNPVTLLEDIYGDDWRVPKPYFLHKW
ncbi:hypothetical protein A9Q94_19465 [Rhodobacterales bacterium 56_14_T64]|nr:hypothetical protein A9Q94_19465 [Rhodobacterales bacterium 56_14_T64]